MKPGDFIINRSPYGTVTGVILYNNTEGGTLKILNTGGAVSWVVTSECEVISEGRKFS